MLSCPHSLTPSLGRECERARACAYTHTTHTNTGVHVHNRREMVLQRSSFYACTSPVGTLENSFQCRFSEMPGRLYAITVDRWKLSPDRFSWNRCPIILPPRATWKTTCYALLVVLSFSPDRIFVEFSCVSIRYLSLIIICNNCDLSFILFLYWIFRFFPFFFFFFLIGEYGRIVLQRYRPFRIITGIIKYRKTHSGSVKVDMSIYHLPTAFLIVSNGAD